MRLVTLKAKAEEVCPTRPDPVLQPVSADQIGAGRSACDAQLDISALHGSGHSKAAATLRVAGTR